MNMARLAVADGIETLVVTPHHLNGIYENGADSIRAACAGLRRELMVRGIGLGILPGAECHLVYELPEAINAGTAMTVAGRGRAALVELPVHHVPHGATDILEDILGLGVQPIIAHPERNAQLGRDPGLLREWVEGGCLAQVTAQSCTGRFGAKAQAAARTMVREGLIHFLASDAHRDYRRVPELSKGRAAVSAWTSAEVGRLLTETFPKALVRGDAVQSERLDEALAAPRAGRWPWQRRRSGPTMASE